MALKISVGISNVDISKGFIFIMRMPLGDTLDVIQFIKTLTVGETCYSKFSVTNFLSQHNTLNNQMTHCVDEYFVNWVGSHYSHKSLIARNTRGNYTIDVPIPLTKIDGSKTELHEPSPILGMRLSNPLFPNDSHVLVLYVNTCWICDTFFYSEHNFIMICQNRRFVFFDTYDNSWWTRIVG